MLEGDDKKTLEQSRRGRRREATRVEWGYRFARLARGSSPGTPSRMGVGSYFLPGRDGILNQVEMEGEL